MSDLEASALARAAAALPAELRDTPCIRSAWLSELAGHDVWLKLESLQPTHSFKVRGAFTALRAGAATCAGGVVTASAGNHGAAMAWACARDGVALTVFVPREAPRAKLVRIAASGARLQSVAGDYDAAERRGREFAAAHGLPFISPYNDPHVIAGAGTIVGEVLAQVPATREIVVPLGGGGLASGAALAVRGTRPLPRLVAAEPAASPAFTTALRAGAIVPIEVGETIADGLAGNIEPGSLTFDLVRQSGVCVVTVPEPAIRKAVADLLREEHLVAEGAAAAAVAAVAARAAAGTPEVTVVVLTGSNIDERRLAALIGESGPPDQIS